MHHWPSREWNFVRTRKRGIQARAWVDGCMWNLGLHPIRSYVSHDAACTRASLVGREFLKRVSRTPRPCPAAVLLEMKAVVVDGRPLVPAHVWPRWVFFDDASGTFGARNGKGPTARVLTGFPDPRAAYTAARDAFAGGSRRPDGEALERGGDAQSPVLVQRG